MASASRRLFRRFLPALLVPAALVVFGLAAAAPSRHLHLERSSPADSSVVSPPDSLQLWYSERPQIAVTRVTVTTARGDTVHTGTPTLATADNAPVVVPFLHAPAAGKHTVAWRTMSADGHVVRGTFVFTVRSAAP